LMGTMSSRHQNGVPATQHWETAMARHASSRQHYRTNIPGQVGLNLSAAYEYQNYPMFSRRNTCVQHWNVRGHWTAREHYDLGLHGGFFACSFVKWLPTWGQARILEKLFLDATSTLALGLHIQSLTFPLLSAGFLKPFLARGAYFHCLLGVSSVQKRFS
jgi:hypothetical protein